MRATVHCAYMSVILCMACGGGLTILPAQETRSAQAPSEMFLKNYTEGTSWFPAFWRPYLEEPLPQPDLENSPRLGDLIRDGRLELTLADALALALENNLDIAIQRFAIPISQTDELRTKAGSAARGFAGALVPGALSAGALGAGVSTAAGAGGVGSAGGITGGGGAVNVGTSGTFDPSLNFNFSWDRNTSPLNTIQVSGIPSVRVTSTAFSGAYTQLFPTGTSYFVALNGLSQDSTQQFLRFNPAVITRFTAGFNQPLLNGLGRLSNQRFLLVARNNRRVSEEVFHQQVIATVVRVENAYWEMAAFRDNVGVAEKALSVAERLLRENRTKAEIGVMAALDVTSAQSEVASRQRDLIIARTNLELQEITLKNLLSKKTDSLLDSVRVVIMDPLPAVQDRLPDPAKALAGAYESRPDLRQALTNYENQEIAARYTETNLKPNLAVFGLYAGSGLDGNTVTAFSGAGGSLSQAFSGDFTEQAGGMSLSVPIRNRAAQADDLRARLERSQLQLGLQRTRNQIALEVRQAVIGLVQGKAQLEAAQQSVQLAREALLAEQEKLQEGMSTSYNEILRERDLSSAELAEVQAHVNYAKALVEMDRSSGNTLASRGIQLADALSGSVGRLPGVGSNSGGSRTEEK